jgi:hypothetical protein
MLARLSVLAALATVLLVLANAGSRSANALQTSPEDCDAKYGVRANPNKPPHPVLWPSHSVLTVTIGNPDSNGDRDIELDGTDPVIDVSGTVDKDKWVVAHGNGTYSGFQTGVDFVGRLAYWNNAPDRLRVIGGVYRVGTHAELPGGAPITYSMFCPVDPDPTIADQDADSVDAKALDEDPTVTIDISGYFDPGRDVTLAYRDDQDAVHQATMPAGHRISFLGQFNAAFEAIFEKRYNEIRTSWGGAWAFPGGGSIGITFPASLGADEDTGVPIGGEMLGYNTFYQRAQGVGNFDMAFNAVAGSAGFAGAQAHTGTWRLTTNDDPLAYGGIFQEDERYSEDDYEVAYHPDTGKIDVTLTLYLVSENLGLVSGTASTAGAGSVGDPIPFTVTIKGLPERTPAGLSALDNCPAVSNADQADADADGVGDACEGFFWGDPTCDGFAGLLDALDTLRVEAGAEVMVPRAGCPHFGDRFGQLTFGDWNCDGERNPLDALALIERRALNPPVGPSPCPLLGAYLQPPG